MKKILSIIGMFICSLFIFAACGIEGGTEVAGVKFVRDVFYVDFDVKTFLDYKVYPGTAKDYVANLPIVSGEFEFERNFTLVDGYITVKRPANAREEATLVENFLITVRVSIGSYSDTCDVRLKKYPSSITTAKSRDTVLGGSEYQIDVQGLFGEEFRSLREGEYNYKLTSTDESVIMIKDEQNLRVQSTGKKGSATIGVQVLNSAGQTVRGLNTNITLDVEGNIGDYIVSLGALRLMDGGEYNLAFQQDQSVELDVRYVDGEGILISDGNFSVTLSGDPVFEISKSGGVFLRVVGKGTATLKIQSTGLGADQKPIQFSCKLTVA